MNTGYNRMLVGVLSLHVLVHVSARLLCMSLLHVSAHVSACVLCLHVLLGMCKAFYLRKEPQKESQLSCWATGTELVRRAIQKMVEGDADEVVLEAEVTNTGALRLYENLGFLRDKRLSRWGPCACPRPNTHTENDDVLSR
jgi:hypothetical protein